MYKKETADKKHHTNPYRAVNYIRDENGNPICPNGRKFLFKRKQHVRYKKYGRTEEIYPSLLSVPFFKETGHSNRKNLWSWRSTDAKKYCRPRGWRGKIIK